MRPDDVDAVDHIAAHVHVHFPEPKAVFANRQAVYPAGAMILERQGTDGAQTVGYILAHPWPTDHEPPKLGGLIDELPISNALYLHDIAILPQGRGGGAGAKALQQLKDLARAEGYSRIWLTAVDGADHYWSQNGFTRVGNEAPYGEGTMVMEYWLD